MSQVRNLDVLRPEQRIVRLGGEDIDVSFIPTGLTFDIDEVTREMAGLDQKKVRANDPGELRKAFDLSVRLCAVFCSWRHPEMTEQWFRENTSTDQLQALSEEIREALTRAFAGIDDSKNQAAAEAS